MALGPASPWQMTIYVKDNNGKSSSMSLSFNPTQTAANMDANVAAVTAILEQLTDAAIFTVSYSRYFYEQDPLTPGPSSEVERKLRIPLGTAQFLPGVSSVEIPSPLFSLESEGTDVVLPTAGSPLEDLVDFLTSGRTLPANGPTTYTGDDITRVGTMTVVHRNRKARR